MEDLIIIVGWNQRTKLLLNKFKEHNALDKIVLVDSTLNSLPEEYPNIKFVKGDPYSIEVLQRANIEQTKSILITSDPSKNESKADKFSILITVTAKGIKPDIKVVAEMQKQGSIQNAKRSGVDIVIDKNDIMSEIIFNQLVRSTNNEFIEKTISRGCYTQEVDKDLVGKSFRQCHSECMKKSQLLIGLIKDDKMVIKPPSDELIESNTLLVLISSDQAS